VTETVLVWREQSGGACDHCHTTHAELTQVRREAWPEPKRLCDRCWCKLLLNGKLPE